MSRRRFCPIIDVDLGSARDARRAGKRILFEGAQGAMLDVDHGTYPFVTSSNTVAGQRRRRVGTRAPRRSAMCSASPRPIRHASAAARSRPNCIDEIGAADRRSGPEFGTSRVGAAAAAGSMPSWCARPSRRRGIDGIALTKLDILDGFDEIKVCVGYLLDGERIDRFAGEPGCSGARRADL